jgi:hypothetical protein
MASPSEDFSCFAYVYFVFSVFHNSILTFVVGLRLFRQAAAALGRKGGLAKSDRKTAACRANGSQPKTKKG